MSSSWYPYVSREGLLALRGDYDRLREASRLSREDSTCKRYVRDTVRDMSASAMAIEELVKCDPLAALQHPNCPAELWWQLATVYPVEARKTTLGGLLLLENPGYWQALAENHAQDWLRIYAGHLINAEPWAVECLWRVLHIWETHHPEDARAREAIVAREAWASSTEEAHKELHTAWQAARNKLAPNAACTSGKCRDVLYAIRETGSSLWRVTARVASWYANRTDGMDLRTEEWLWQWDRLCWYLAQQEAK